MNRPRARLLIALLAAGTLLVGTGCGKEEPEQPADPDARPRHRGYTGALIDGKHHAEETTAVVVVEQSIKAFQAMEGRLPKSLEELEQWQDADLPELPRGRAFRYNAASGELKVTNVPEQ